MNIMRAKDGSYGISGYDGVISPAYCIYYPRQKVNPQYLYYLFKAPMYMEIFKIIPQASQNIGCACIL